MSVTSVRKKRATRVGLTKVISSHFKTRKSLLLFVEDIYRDYNRRVATGLLNALDRDWHLLVLRPPQSVSEMTAALDRHSPDAAAILGLPERCREVLIERGIPSVELGVDRFPRSPIPVIETDDEAIGAMAAEHFLQRGYREFAVFDNSGLERFTRRIRGFQRRLARENLRVRAHSGSKSGEDPYDLNSLPEKTDEWLVNLPKPVALFCVNDPAGALVVERCRELGIVVPEDVAVLGVDNSILVCLTTWPPISSVQPDFERLGARCAELVCNLDSFPARHFVERIPPREIVCRESTAMRLTLDPVVSRAVAYIEQHIDLPFKVADLLAVTGVSGPTLSSRFKASLGHTPIEEIRMQRIERARKLLLQDQPIVRVAKASGFQSTTHFCKAFRELTGQSPGDYRREMRAK